MNQPTVETHHRGSAIPVRLAERPARRWPGRHRRIALEIVRQSIAELILFGLGIIMLLPFLWLISGSLKSEAEVFNWPPTLLPTTPHWENYPRALTILPFNLFFRNTLIIAVLATVGTTISSSLVAFALARLRFPGRRLLFGLVLSTMMLPGIVTMIPKFILFKQLGWVDTWQPLWVPDFFGSPFYIFLMRQFFLTMPLELDEAARVDGASNWRIWAQIDLPLAVPAVATVAVFTFVFNWNDFLGPLIYLNTMEKRTVALGLAAFNGIYSAEYNLMLAASVAAIVPVLVVFFCAQRFFVKGIVMSGIAGR
ncbi:MAG: carbohydrate ABC transporter permease [Chloroflexi bacterium]|nr:carbohydrate ABC transporter permease [Chloroflexota bacterium]